MLPSVNVSRSVFAFDFTFILLSQRLSYPARCSICRLGRTQWLLCVRIPRLSSLPHPLPVMLVILSVLLENSGLLKAGGRTPEFEPLQQKPVKFSDVHGIDEVKQACSTSPDHTLV